MSKDNWKIFYGTNIPDERIKKLPPAPPWRRFDNDKKSAEEIKGITFRIGERAVELVNAALYLRRPLLVTGRPGTGKSSLAYAIAYELTLGSVLKWPINTRTTLQEALYLYDAIARLQDAQINQKISQEISISSYIRLGPLGTAFLPNQTPRVLLIDEIDKSDIDLPNDLLNLFEEGEFDIPELVRISGNYPEINVQTYDNTSVTIENGRVRCTEFPLIIMTSNGERDFPPAFLRRCLQLEMPEPNLQELSAIVKSHFSSDSEILRKAEELITYFVEKRDLQDQNLATDQLLNTIFMLTGDLSSDDKEILLDHLLHPLDRVRGDSSEFLS